jgi:hypothetical protein
MILTLYRIANQNKKLVVEQRSLTAPIVGQRSTLNPPQFILQLGIRIGICFPQTCFNNEDSIDQKITLMGAVCISL